MMRMFSLTQRRRDAEKRIIKFSLCILASLRPCVLILAISMIFMQPDTPPFEALFVNATHIEEIPLEVEVPYAQLPEAVLARVSECEALPEANGLPSVSPDGSYVVYFDCFSLDVERYSVYVYETESGEVDTLGESLPDTEIIWVDRWLDDTQVALRSTTYSGTYGVDTVYVGDVTQPDSLREIATQYVLSPRFEPDPARYVWVTDDGQQHSVHSYNAASGEDRILFQRECVLLDEFGCATITAHENASFADGTAARLALLIGTPLSIAPKQLEVYDLANDELIYTAELMDIGRVEWLDADTLVLHNVEYDLAAGTVDGRLVRFGSDGVEEMNLQRVYSTAGIDALSERNRQIFVWALGPDDGAVNVRDLTTGDEMPLLCAPPQGYIVYLEWDESAPNTVQATIMDDAYTLLARWKIALNAQAQTCPHNGGMPA